jgi:chaperone BCS1
MLPQLFKEAVNTFIHNPNQFASGGLLLMATGAVMAYFRALPAQIYERFLHLFSMTITMTDDSQGLKWFKWWFDQHRRSKKIRHVDVFTPYRNEKYLTLLTPAPGAHWFMHMHRPFRLEFTREKEKPKYAEKRPETITLRVIGRDQSFLKRFVEDIHKKYDEAYQNKINLYFWTRDGWESVDLAPRSWDSVILPAKLKKDVVEDIKDFQDSRAWYDSVGMPYHRSYLFHGPPGTGKTSSLLGLSSYFQKSLYLLKLHHMTDDTLVSALRRVDANSMVVLEDVDCLNNKRRGVVKEKKKKKDDEEKDKAVAGGLTLSGLLNALDGIETPSGSMFFMTTNLIKKLDPALLRPGRVDRKYYLGPATREQKIEMFERFFPRSEAAQAAAFTDQSKSLTMAEFQEELKQKRGAYEVVRSEIRS